MLGKPVRGQALAGGVQWRLVQAQLFALLAGDDRVQQDPAGLGCGRAQQQSCLAQLFHGLQQPLRLGQLVEQGGGHFADRGQDAQRGRIHAVQAGQHHLGQPGSDGRRQLPAQVGRAQQVAGLFRVQGKQAQAGCPAGQTPVQQAGLRAGKGRAEQ